MTTNDPRDEAADRLIAAAPNIVDEIYANLDRNWWSFAIAIPHNRHAKRIQEAFEQEWVKRGVNDVSRYFSGSFNVGAGYAVFTFRAIKSWSFRGLSISHLYLPPREDLTTAQRRELDKLLEGIVPVLMSGNSNGVIREY